MSTAILERLARIEERQTAQGDLLERGVATLEKLDHRLRLVEQKSTLYGALSGGIIAVGVALASAKLTGKT